MQLTKGKIQSAIKAVFYGVAGIGKSTLASKFPAPVVFIDTEGSTSQMDVLRTPKPLSWTQIINQIDYFLAHPQELKTLVIDTADWAEKLCTEQFCANKQVSGIEDMPYGKGYVYVADDFGKMLNKLEELKDKGVHIVLTAHAALRKVEQPDEMGSYDRWEMKLSKKIAPLVKEWADMVIFCNYKTIVINVDGQGATKGRNKAQGNKRMMYANYNATFDAKNRFGLPDEMPMDYAQIAHIFVMPEKAPEKPVAPPIPDMGDLSPAPAVTEEAPKAPESAPIPTLIEDDGIPPALKQLMTENNVTEQEIMYVVSGKGYYPTDTPIARYDPDFIRGVLIGAWTQVYNMILKTREKAPF